MRAIPVAAGAREQLSTDSGSGENRPFILCIRRLPLLFSPLLDISLYIPVQGRSVFWKHLLHRRGVHLVVLEAIASFEIRALDVFCTRIWRQDFLRSTSVLALDRFPSSTLLHIISLFTVFMTLF